MAAARHPVLVWSVALLWLVVIGAAITRTDVLWGPTTFENARDLRGFVFGQIYRAARRFARPDPRRPLLLLGNSRIWLPARPGLLEPLIERSRHTAPAAVDNLAVFGAGVGDLVSMARHLDAHAARGVVLAIGATDLVPTSVTPIEGPVSTLLATGASDGPLGPDSWPTRIDRWGRTLWPLYRYREFVRAALIDKVAPNADARATPDSFPSRRAFFDWVHGVERGGEIEAAFARWQREGTLAAWVAYLELASPGNLGLVRTRTRELRNPQADGPGARSLDAALAEIRRRGLPALVIVMPEHPILAQDVRGEFHRVDTSTAAFDVIAEVAARHGTPVWDARAVMPAAAFLDFDHLLPSVSGFQEPLVAALVEAGVT